MTILPFILLNPSTLLMVAAIVPAAVLLVYVYRKDTLEKEPVNLLVKLVLWGILSTVLASATESLGDLLLSGWLDETTTLYSALFFFLVVGLSEEGFKYLLLRWKSWKNPNFNCTFDGVVYATFVSLGFALWENVLYTFSYGLGTALVRACTSIPGHCCFGVFMGAFYGAAKRAELRGDPDYSRRLRWAAVLSATILHGLYDFLATLPQDGAALIFIVYIAALFIICYRVINRLAKQDRYIA